MSESTVATQERSGLVTRSTPSRLSRAQEFGLGLVIVLLGVVLAGLGWRDAVLGRMNTFLNFDNFIDDIATPAPPMFTTEFMCMEMFGLQPMPLIIMLLCVAASQGEVAAFCDSTDHWLIRTLISELRPVRADPASFLTPLDASVRNVLRHTQMPLFAFAFYLVADLTREELRCANAGHPPPLRLKGRSGASPKKPASLRKLKPDPVLRLFDGIPYERQRGALASSDVAAVFTDELFEVESKAGEFYNHHRLARAIGRHGGLNPVELCEKIIHEVEDFSVDVDFSDDACLAAMQIEQLHGVDAGHSDGEPSLGAERA
jgi:hypothetical protein